MAKEIVKQDVSEIELLLEKVLGTRSYKQLSRMGGLTNHTYKVVLDNDEEYVVRIPGEGTEQMIARNNEMVSTKLACELEIDAELLYFGNDGSKITKYIPNAITMSAEELKKSEHIEQVASVLKKLHTCGNDTKIPFEVFDMAESYEKIIRAKSVSMFDDYETIKAAVMRVKKEIDTLIKISKVPCHNDPLCENWVKGDGRMYLIDWEYAGMNDGMWDLADISIEAEYEEAHDELLLRAYIGKEANLLDKKHFLSNKIYVDYLWTLWAKARVPYDGQPMEDWAVERYTRLKGFIERYKEM